MALREFRDAHGVDWQMWDIVAEEMHPLTAREMFIGDYQEGWLVMESAAERRRIAPIPVGWAEWPDAALDDLVARANVVPRRPGGAQLTPSAGVPRFESVPAGLETRAGAAAAAGSGSRATGATHAGDFDPYASRSFTGPGGRRWTAQLITIDTAPEPVLRFTSIDRVCDLRLWPTDWERQSTEQLVELLRRATPAAPSTVRQVPHDATQRRRREDRLP